MSTAVGGLADECNFWTQGGFQPTINRFDSRLASINELRIFSEEFSALLSRYVKQLSAFYVKWKNRTQKSVDDGGTIGECWESILDNLEVIVEDETTLAENLKNYPEIPKEWEKTALSSRKLKIQKHFSKKFKSAQEKWVGHFNAYKKSENSFSNAARRASHVRRREQLIHIERTRGYSITEPSSSKVASADAKVVHKRQLCKKRISALDEIKTDYIEAMRKIFDECQTVDCAQLLYIKRMTESITCKINENYAKINKRSTKNFKKVSLLEPLNDLQKWSLTSGPEMDFPEFDIDDLLENGSEENPNFSKNYAKPTGSVLTPIDKYSDLFKDLEKFKITSPPQNGNIKDNGDFTENEVSTSCLEKETSLNSFDDAATLSNPVLIEAIQSFDGTEGDEITFKKGDRMLQLTRENSSNWIKCLAGSEVGYVPYKYVRTLSIDGS